MKKWSATIERVRYGYWISFSRGFMGEMYPHFRFTRRRAERFARRKIARLNRPVEKWTLSIEEAEHVTKVMGAPPSPPRSSGTHSSGGG